MRLYSNILNVYGRAKHSVRSVASSRQCQQHGLKTQQASMVLLQRQRHVMEFKATYLSLRDWIWRETFQKTGRDGSKRGIRSKSPHASTSGENKYRVASFITCIGSEALEVYNGLPFENEEDKHIMSNVMELMERHCIGQTNVIYERYCFNNRNQESGESFDTYLTVLRTLAKPCNFGSLARHRNQKEITARAEINTPEVYRCVPEAMGLTMQQISTTFSPEKANFRRNYT